MKTRIFSLRFSPTEEGFQTKDLDNFMKDSDIISVSDHFFLHEGHPWLCLIVSYREDNRRNDVPISSKHVSTQSEVKKDWRDTLDDERKQIFDLLRHWRAVKSQKDGLPPYVILTNRQVAEIVQANVTSVADLRKIDGIGDGKIQRFGNDILAILQQVKQITQNIEGVVDGEL